MRSKQSQRRRSASPPHVRSFYLLYLVLMENGERKRQMNLSFRPYLTFWGASWEVYLGLGLPSLFPGEKHPDHVERFVWGFPHCNLSLHDFLFFFFCLNYHFCTVYGQNNGNTCFISVDSFLGGHVQKHNNPTIIFIGMRVEQIQMSGAPRLT